MLSYRDFVGWKFIFDSYVCLFSDLSNGLIIFQVKRKIKTNTIPNIFFTKIFLLSFSFILIFPVKTFLMDFALFTLSSFLLPPPSWWTSSSPASSTGSALRRRTKCRKWRPSVCKRCHFDVFDRNADVVNLCSTRCWVIATMPLSLARSWTLCS